MKTWTATATAEVHPAALLDVLTDPDAAARWAPVPFDVDYRLAPHAAGSEVHASISVRPSRGLAGRLLAEATSALLNAGALEQTLARLTREAAAT
jgi:hypothetical protein